MCVCCVYAVCLFADVLYLKFLVYCIVMHMFVCLSTCVYVCVCMRDCVVSLCVVFMLCVCLYVRVVHVRYKRILVLVSHSQDFLNGVCTNIIHLHKCGLVYYGVSALP